jgi:hypothetical protein
MKLLKGFGTLLCLAVLCVIAAPTATADDWNRETVVTFSGPVEVPGVGEHILPAGTYVFKIMDSEADRHIVQIFSEDKTHVLTTILAVPNYRLKVTGKTVITFRERPEGQPEALRAWFYPGHAWGEEFVYPKSKALELAKVVNEPVLTTPAEIATIEDLKTAPIEAVKPTGEPVSVAEVVQAPPVEEAKMEEPKTLPHTASYLPLLALVGLLSLAGAGVLTKYSA